MDQNQRSTVILSGSPLRVKLELVAPAGQISFVRATGLYDMPHDPPHTVAEKNAQLGIRPFRTAKTSELVIMVARYAAMQWPRQPSDQVAAAAAELDLRIPVP